MLTRSVVASTIAVSLAVAARHPQQQLVLFDAARADVQHQLSVQDEEVTLQRIPDALLPADARLDLCLPVCLRLEHRHAVPALLLRPVHREVGA